MPYSYPTDAEVQQSVPDLTNIQLPTEFLQEVEQNTTVGNESPYDVVWEPIPDSSQVLAITSPAHHTLYCGARGPGVLASLTSVGEAKTKRKDNHSDNEVPFSCWDRLWFVLEGYHL